MSFHVKVKRKREWFNYIIISLMFLVFAVLMHATIHVECTRSAAAQPARCWGHTTTAYSSYWLPPFTLERDAFRMGKSKPNRRGYQYTALVAPTGQLESYALDPDFARRVIAETNAFYEDKDALAWHAADSMDRVVLISLAIGIGLLALFLWLSRAIEIVIDPREGFISRGKDVWLISQIENVYQRDSWKYGSELELTVGGISVTVFDCCQKESATEATAAIKRAMEAAAGLVPMESLEEEKTA